MSDPDYLFTEFPELLSDGDVVIGPNGFVTVKSIYDCEDSVVVYTHEDEDAFSLPHDVKVDVFGFTAADLGDLDREDD